MRIGRGIGTILRAAVVVAVAYAIYHWGFDEKQDDSIHDFAKNACISAVKNRFDTRSVKIDRITKSSKGYVLRGSASLANGRIAKIYCLNNEHGGVEDIGLQERS